MRVVVNAAMSVDGKLATRRREQLRISGLADFDRVDALRAEASAVLVGVGTVLADDPSLTVDDPARLDAREAAGRPRQPVRVVADSLARTPTESRLLDDEAGTIVLVSESAEADAVAHLEAAGAEIVQAGDEQVDLTAGLAALEERGIDSLLAEGGGELIFSLFEAGLVDELAVYVAPIVIGGRDAPTLADGEGFVDDLPSLSLVDVQRLDGGVVLAYDVADS